MEIKHTHFLGATNPGPSRSGQSCTCTRHNILAVAQGRQLLLLSRLARGLLWRSRELSRASGTTYSICCPARPVHSGGAWSDAARAPRKASIAPRCATCVLGNATEAEIYGPCVYQADEQYWIKALHKFLVDEPTSRSITIAISRITTSETVWLHDADKRAPSLLFTLFDNNDGDVVSLISFRLDRHRHGKVNTPDE